MENKPQECTDWAEVLALTPVDMLSPTQQEALTAHMQHCQACETLVKQYRDVDLVLSHYFSTQAVRRPVSLLTLLCAWGQHVYVD